MNIFHIIHIIRTVDKKAKKTVHEVMGQSVNQGRFPYFKIKSYTVQDL